MHIPKPDPAEYDAYAKRYVDLVPDDGRVLAHLAANFTQFQQYILTLPTEKLSTPFKAGEWTVKEILLHLVDAERILAYRALRFARHDQQDLTGFEQDEYIAYSHAHERSLNDIFEEYHAVRTASIKLFQPLSAADLACGGLTSGYRVTVAALVYMIAGHELWHWHSIRENYGD
jgi:uncharacterized damage-inducible protein DinB